MSEADLAELMRLASLSLELDFVIATIEDFQLIRSTDFEVSVSVSVSGLGHWRKL
jgi:hypothetical protein